MAAVIPTHQCQRCRLPLILHDSLNDISQAQFNLLISSKDATNRFQSSFTGGALTKPPFDVTSGGIKQTKLTKSPGDSFVVLSDSFVDSSQLVAVKNAHDSVDGRPVDAKTNKLRSVERYQQPRNAILQKGSNEEAQNHSDSFSQREQTLESLFNILSSKSHVDFPVCSDCAELLKEGLKSQFEESCKERDVFIRFLHELKEDPKLKDVEQIRNEIKELERNNEDAMEELKQLEKERMKVELEFRDLTKRSNELDTEELRFYESQNQFSGQLREFDRMKDRTDSIYEKFSNQLQKLQKINVHNDAFCIGHDGHFGTINGLRLGRLKDKMVEWSEINAAWGQTLLLIATVIHKLNFKLDGYKIRPLGSASRIDKLELDSKSGDLSKVISLELFSGDYSIERLNHKRLDAAMVAFLNILNQVGQHVESLDPSLKLPYSILKDKIGDYSIRFTKASNESWTTACKYVLTNAKWILAYASTR